MVDAASFRVLANSVLVLHVAIVLFVVGGLLLIIIGNARGWRWVNRWSFRLLHLAAIATVVAESWFGLVCPLTAVEQWLRARAAVPTYAGSLIEHSLQSLLYYEAPSWVFTLSYTVFGLAVLVAWFMYPPRSGVPRERAA